MIPPTDPTPSPAPRPRRRWWSLSVRGLMVLVLIVGGLVGWEASRVSRMRRAVAVLERPVQVPAADLGPLAAALRGAVPGTDPETVRVTYADSFEGWAWLKVPAAGRVVGWLRRAVGDDHFRRVQALGFWRRPAAEDWDAIGSLGTVERLNLAGYNVVDDDLVRLREGDRLRDLDLSDTLITDRTLAIVGELPALRTLDVDRTHVSSEGLAALAGQVGLEELALPDEMDADAGLIHLRGLRNLRSLVAGRISDRGLAALRGKDRLKTLAFVAWNVTDEGWAVVTGFRDLKELRVRPGRSNFARLLFGRPEEGRPITLSAAAVGALGRLADLETLHLGDLGDAPWASPLAALARLRNLDIGGSWVDDATLAAVGNLDRLESLTVDGDPITDAGLAPLGCLPNLKNLTIKSPGVTDAGLKHLAPLTRLNSLFLTAHATSEGIAALRTSLPGGCFISNIQHHKKLPAQP